MIKGRKRIRIGKISLIYQLFGRKMEEIMIKP